MQMTHTKFLYENDQLICVIQSGMSYEHTTYLWHQEVDNTILPRQDLKVWRVCHKIRVHWGMCQLHITTNSIKFLT